MADGCRDPVGIEPSRCGDLLVGDCRIRWVEWGGDTIPAVVLVHGSRANWHWWQAAAEGMIRSGHRVLALDLSGHGDSARRRTYGPELWAEEVAALIALRTNGEAVIAGHSMGGLVAISTAALHSDQVRSLVLVDVNVRHPDPSTGAEPRGTEGRPLRTYGSLQEAIDAFRLLPEQPIARPELVASG